MVLQALIGLVLLALAVVVGIAVLSFTVVSVSAVVSSATIGFSKIKYLVSRARASVQATSPIAGTMGAKARRATTGSGEHVDRAA